MIKDPYPAGIASGWRLLNAAEFVADREDEADVVIVGSGAGGGLAAEMLARAGLKVIVVEEGPLRSTDDFHMRESEAYPRLYQESAARKTADKAINILQGRCVGGSTTVNWTSCFRTPRSHAGLLAKPLRSRHLYFRCASALVRDGRAPSGHPSMGHATQRQQPDPARRGRPSLVSPPTPYRRNVTRCWNIGYCGTGCPTGAKQSMLLTTLPAALEHGATIYHGLRAQRLVLSGNGARLLECQAMDAQGIHARPVRVSLRARHFVLAGGAIGTPALLLRSAAPDPHQRLGGRTFLHPTVVSAALMDGLVEGYAGAPQTIYSDHFLDNRPVDGPYGYKLEVPPLHPVLVATTLQGFGAAHATLMRSLPRVQVILALLRDGFNDASKGGQVRLRGDGTPVLDYPLDEMLWEGARRALASMAEIQFAAGAKRVYAVHEECAGWDDWSAARAGIAALEMRPLAMRIVSAHVMGGCGMGADPRSSRRPIRPAGIINWRMSPWPMALCSRPASAPIHKSRSTASSPATYRCWRRC